MKLSNSFGRLNLHYLYLMLSFLFEILISFLLSFKKGKTGIGIVIAFAIVVLGYAVLTIVTKSDLSR